MTDITASIATAIQAKTGGNVEGKIPEWWAEFIGMVLDELQCTGRLIPAGGMALTAEQVEDVKIVLGQLERGGPAFEAAHERLRALFPATEPAEAPCTICNVNETNHAGVSYYHPFTTELGPFDDEGNDRPAPAEPAEEETKAEDYCCHPKCRFTDWGGINRKHERGADCPIVPKPASSPVVPAPTETEWQTLQEVPEGVTRVLDSECELWVQEGGQWFSTCQLHNPAEYAPFVAVEEG